jgi:hypothetical protein
MNSFEDISRRTALVVMPFGKKPAAIFRHLRDVVTRLEVCMGRLFEQFFPQPAALKTGQKWQVFISYRSLDRPWVLKLHNAVKYEVFVDQFVLNATAGTN